MVVEALRRAAAAVAAARPGVDADALTRLCGGLSALYQESSERVDEHEYPALDSQVVHGDWHPGNVLFDGDRVCGVLDFDSARLEPAIADVANGLLQFAVRSGPLRAIAQWPVELDEALFAAFARGFAGPDPGAMQRFVEMVPWLMIEACIAEASIPIAQTGFFAAVPGDQMLAMIARRTEWIRFHSPLLSQRLAREIVG
jgi:aminoglycoside phosphotransferase (APT) family kinase protein